MNKFNRRFPCNHFENPVEIRAVVKANIDKT